MHGGFLQLGYVTSDFERGLEELQALHGLGPMKQMRELQLPTGEGREAVGHFALAFRRDVQYELIAPLAGDVGLYRSALPASGYALRLHHLGECIESPAAYEAALGRARRRWTVPIEQAAFGGFYAYADARADLGHFMEYFCFPLHAFFGDVPRY